MHWYLVFTVFLDNLTCGEDLVCYDQPLMKPALQFITNSCILCGIWAKSTLRTHFHFFVWTRIRRGKGLVWDLKKKMVKEINKSEHRSYTFPTHHAIASHIVSWQEWRTEKNCICVSNFTVAPYFPRAARFHIHIRWTNPWNTAVFTLPRLRQMSINNQLRWERREFGATPLLLQCCTTIGLRGRNRGQQGRLNFHDVLPGKTVGHILLYYCHNSQPSESERATWSL